MLKQTLQPSRALSQHVDQELMPVRGSTAERRLPDISISIIGVFRSRGDFYWEQVSPGFCIHIITGGAGVFVVEGRTYEAGAGTLFLFRPDQYIRYWDAPETPWRYTWIALNGNRDSWVLEEAGLIRAPARRSGQTYDGIAAECTPESVRRMSARLPAKSRDAEPLFHLSGLPAFYRELEEIVDTFRRQSYSSLYPYYAALKLADLLGRHTAGAVRTASEPLEVTAKKLIDSNQFAVPGIEELAGNLEVDRTTLYKAFRKTYGTSVKGYIDASRLEKACRLLASSTSAIKEIAFTCGYRDSRYFSRVFRNRFGCTPSEWRDGSVSS